MVSSCSHQVSGFTCRITGFCPLVPGAETRGSYSIRQRGRRVAHNPSLLGAIDRLAAMSVTIRIRQLHTPIFNWRGFQLIRAPHALDPPLPKSRCRSPGLHAANVAVLARWCCYPVISPEPVLILTSISLPFMVCWNSPTSQECLSSLTLRLSLFIKLTIIEDLGLELTLFSISLAELAQPSCRISFVQALKKVRM